MTLNNVTLANLTAERFYFQCADLRRPGNHRQQRRLGGADDGRFPCHRSKCYAAVGLTFNVSNPTNGHVAFAANPGAAIPSFTESDLEAGNVIFVHDGTNTTQATFKVSVSDGTYHQRADDCSRDGADGHYRCSDARMVLIFRTTIRSCRWAPANCNQRRHRRRKLRLSIPQQISSSCLKAWALPLTTISIRPISSAAPLPQFTLSRMIQRPRRSLISPAASTRHRGTTRSWRPRPGNQTPFDALTSGWSLNFIGGAGVDAFGAAATQTIFSRAVAATTFLTGIRIRPR